MIPKIYQNQSFQVHFTKKLLFKNFFPLFYGVKNLNVLRLEIIKFAVRETFVGQVLKVCQKY